MTEIKRIPDLLDSAECEKRFEELYCGKDSVTKQKERYKKILASFTELYGDGYGVEFFSAPGRTEVGGNHTDHNRGKVLAASINLDVVAAAAAADDGIIKEKTAGHSMINVDVNDLSVNPEQFGTSAALIRGMCAGFKKYGYNVGGFRAASQSDVLAGSGLSSSAAYEVLIGTILNHLYNGGKVSPVDIAKIAQYAENEYFGKPCGLMDQMASSVGSFITIDFKEDGNPQIRKVGFDFAAGGYALCIIDTGGNHADLTADYAAVRGEMESAAAVFGGKVLREVDEEEFMAGIPLVREKCGDRAVLRALHFYNENRRVDSEIAALESGDFDTFKALVTESGFSSYMYNQNVYTCKNPAEQGVSLTLALCEKYLQGRGAWRVHGGGFAGTVQAFVPYDVLDSFCENVEKVTGKGTCHILSVRPFGGVKVI